MSNQQGGDAMFSYLELVYPPISNQEAEWLASDPSVAETLRQSDFYFIGMRSEAFFDVPAPDGTPPSEPVSSAVPAAGDGASNEVPRAIAERWREQAASEPVAVTREPGDPYFDELHLGIGTGSLYDRVVIRPSVFSELSADAAPAGWDLTVEAELGAKLVRLWVDKVPDRNKMDQGFLLQWFTTEKLIFDRSRELRGIDGFDRYRDFATYELLYVGIAKETDTFARLFGKAHSGRQRILGNEYARRVGSRVTDEMVLFAFRLVPFRIREIDPATPFSVMTKESWQAYQKRVTADAEKAFIHLLDTRYNEVKYPNYPRSKDGLWEVGHQAYGYAIAENLTFVTQGATFRGGRDNALGVPDPGADHIFVRGENVTLFKAQTGDDDVP